MSSILHLLLFCLHRLISGHKGVLLVSAVNLLKIRCALGFFKRFGW